MRNNHARLTGLHASTYEGKVEMSREEAIKLLKESLEYHPLGHNYKGYIKKVLALLESEPAQSGTGEFKPTKDEVHAYISAWDGDINEKEARYLLEINFLRDKIQSGTGQEQGEFTKAWRDSIVSQNGGLAAIENDLIYINAKEALEACDIIDSLQASLRLSEQENEKLAGDIKKVCDLIRNEGEVSKWKILNWLEQPPKENDETINS